MTQITVSQALARLAEAHTDYSRLIEKRDYDIGLYKPDGVDKQTPHARDELYIVAAGSGEFLCDGESRAFAPGDALFVPEGVEHRFVEFSADFSAWVVFFGERPRA
jgi:mannose-6-phosphate isomerase-like protein (cupin superfamily)